MKAKNSITKKHKRKGVDLQPVLTPPSFSQLTYMDSLIETSTLDESIKSELLSTDPKSEGEAEQIINYLLDNQRCNISGGFNYQSGDIQEMLSKLK